MIDLCDSCSGISGTYGWKEENYRSSMEIGKEMFNHMRELNAKIGFNRVPDVFHAEEAWDELRSTSPNRGNQRRVAAETELTWIVNANPFLFTHEYWGFICLPNANRWVNNG